jgi:hypothetical protein
MCGGGSSGGSSSGGGSSSTVSDREFEAAISQSNANRNSGGGGVSYGSSGYYDSSSGRVTSSDIGGSRQSSAPMSRPTQKVSTIKTGPGGVDPAVAKAAGYKINSDGTATKAVSINAAPATTTETKTVDVGYGPGQMDPALAKAAGFDVANGKGTKTVTRLTGAATNYEYGYAAPVGLDKLKDGQETQLGADGKVISSSGVGSVADLKSQGFDMTTWDEAQPWNGWTSSDDVIGTDVRNANRAANPFDRDGDGSMWTYTDFNGVVRDSWSDEFISGPNDLTTLDGMTKAQYANQVLTDAGYTDAYKGVSGATDKNGNPIQSGSYAQKLAEANAMYDSQLLYRNAYNTEKGNFAREHAQKINDGLVISNDLVETALGRRPDATAQELAAAQQEFGDLYGRGYVVAGGTFDDPLGEYMDANIGTMEGRNLLGSTINTTNSYNNFAANFAKGYNTGGRFKNTNGLDMEVDNSRNVGFSTNMQRFGDVLGNAVLGQIPLVGSALKANTMDIYGPNVPGMNAVASELAINPGGLLGDFIGNYASNYAAQGVGGAIYNNTGNVNAAIAGALGAGSAVGQGANALAQSAASGMGVNPMVISSDISPVANQQYKAGLDNAGFGQSLGETQQKQFGMSTGDGSPDSTAALVRFGADTTATDASTGEVVTQTPLTSESLQTNVESNTAADVATGDLIGEGTETEFDSEAWKNQQAQMNNASDGNVTSLTGEISYDSEPNPMFSMSTPTGVQYLSKGRQRDYGNATYSVANPIKQYRGSRRRGFGDRLVGILV